MRGTLVAAWMAFWLAGCGVASDVSRAVGARCDDSDQCDDRCLVDPEFPGGFCTLSCDDDRDCPGGSRCTDEQGGVCLFACQADPNCGFLGAGWRCDTKAGRGGGEVEVCVGSG